MEYQFENHVIPLHFGISALNTYGSMEYFAQQMERTKKEPVSLNANLNSGVVNDRKTNKFLDQSKLTKPAMKSLDGKTHSCYVCGKILSSISSYYVHMKQHSGHKPYHCPMCEVSFCRKPYLEVHMRTHTGERPFQCSVCLKRFTQKSSLNTHKRSHTGERPYACEFCDKKFAVKSYVDAHRWTHSSEKPLMCEKCQIPFNSRMQYVLHMRSHSPSRIYECPCGRVFTKESYRIRHQIKVHRPHGHNSSATHSTNSVYSASLISDDSNSKDYEFNSSPEILIAEAKRKKIVSEDSTSLPLTTVANAIQEGMQSYSQEAETHLARL